jgi:hypothetical protein
MSLVQRSMLVPASWVTLRVRIVWIAIIWRRFYYGAKQNKRQQRKSGQYNSLRHEYAQFLKMYVKLVALDEVSSRAALLGAIVCPLHLRRQSDR